MKMRVRVCVIDYGMGNITSIENSLKFLAIKYDVISNYNDLKNYSHIILPGVGSFKMAMKNLRKIKLVQQIKNLVKRNEIKILGICLGMQLLGKSSKENGKTNGLGLMNYEVDKFRKNKKIKIPHVGFNQIKIKKNKNHFFNEIKNDADFYFVHSYKINSDKPFDFDYCTCNYDKEFLAGFNKNNIYGTQFHPEKSQSNGLTLLFNFLKS